MHDTIRTIVRQNVLRTLLGEKETTLAFDFRMQRSLQEIGTRFKLTKERIRQIEKKALKQLQQSSRRALLESYVA